MPLSGRRMSEEVVTVTLPEPFGKQDLPLELRRSILVTYLDEELMVVRDESGVAEVLKRELAEVVPATPTPPVEPIVTEAAEAVKNAAAVASGNASATAGGAAAAANPADNA